MQRVEGRVRRLAKAWWPDLRSWPARMARLAVVPMPLRLCILRAVGHRFAPMARIRPGSIVLGANLIVGRDTFINGECLIDAAGEVTLGDEVHIGHGVQILTFTHEPGPTARRAGRPEVAPVHIGDGTWIGAGTIVLPGVTVGQGCVVAAGAVVHDDLPANGLYAGVPARLMRRLD